MSEGSTNFGTFNGNIIADSSTMKGALDSLDTEVTTHKNLLDIWNNNFDKIDGEQIADDTIDDDSLDFGTGADQVSALDIPLDVTNFNGNLTPETSTNVQAALDELDDANAITGTDTHVMFFDGADTPAGDAGMAYDKTNNIITVGGINLSQTAEGSSIQFFEGSENGLNYVEFDAPDSLEEDTVWTLPSADAAGSLQSDGSGKLSFSKSASAVNWDELLSPPGAHRGGVIIDSPEAGSDYEIPPFDYDITIYEIGILAQGSTVTGGFWECDANGANCLTIADDSTAQAGTALSDTGFVNAGVSADNVIKWVTTSVGGTATRVTAWFKYTFDSVLE
jgi:hypothetical protein